MTTIKVSNGMMETTHVEEGIMVYKRLRMQQPTTLEVVEQPIVVNEPVVEEVHVQIPPAHWKGAYVPQPINNIVHVDFGYQPQPKKSKKKLTKLQRIIREILK